MYINKAVALKYINEENNFIDVKDLSENLKNDPDIIVACIKKSLSYMENFNDKLLKDKELMTRVFKETNMDYSKFRNIPYNLRMNKEFAFRALELAPIGLDHIPDELKQTEEFKNKYLNIINDAIKNEKDPNQVERLKILKKDGENIVTNKLDIEKYKVIKEIKNGANLDSINKVLQNDSDVIVTYIKKDQSRINTLSSKLMDNKELLTRVFSEVGRELYTRMSPELLNNKEFMLKLLEVDLNASYELGEDLKNNGNFLEQGIEVLNKNIETLSNNNKNNENKYLIDFTKSNIKYLENQKGHSLQALLGKDKFNWASHYPNTIDEFKKIRNSDKKLLFDTCYNYLDSKNLSDTEWITEVNNLFDRFNDKEYSEFLSNIDTKNIDVKSLSRILEQPNYFNLKTENDLKNYDTLKINVCDNIMQGKPEEIAKYPLISKMNETERVKFAVLQKLVGYDMEQGREIAYQNYQLDEIAKDDKLDIKCRVSAINAIVREGNLNTLNKLYSLNPVPANAQDKSILKEELRSIYMEEYNATLFNPKEANKLPDEYIEKYMPKDIDKSKYNFIDAGLDFNMIMTSIGAYNYTGSNTDYAKSWNREISNSKQFCCSYIGNDMIATAPIKNICYGFTNMDNNSLLLLGRENLNSCTFNDKLSVPVACRMNYFKPQQLKENTSYYNEMVFKREQNGIRKQPDYLLVFKKNDKIEGNIYSTLQAVDNFKKEGIDIPIVFVDVDRCMENEKNKINDMILTAKENDSQELLEAAKIKAITNSKTDGKFFENILDDCRNLLTAMYVKLRENTSNKTNEIETNEEVANKNDNIINEDIYAKSYEETTVQERKKEVSEIVRLNKQIKNIKEAKDER